MAEVKIQVGAGLAPSFKSTLHEASTVVSRAAVEMHGPLLQVAQGAGVVSTAFRFLGDIVKGAILGPLGSMVVGLGGVSAAFWLLNKASSAAHRGLQAFKTVEDLESQFRPLLGSIAATKGRIAELADFAAKTPFELPEVAAASKTLEVLTRGALSTGEGLRIVGELAAQSARPFTELAMWVGRLYDGLMSGRPVGEAMMRLQELGLVSGVTRTKIEELQKAGKSGNEVWKIMTAEFSRANGSMVLMSQTLTGLESTLEDTRKALSRAIGNSFAKQEAEAIAGATEVTENFIPIAEKMMQTLASLGVTQTSHQWVPLFDKQLKQLVASLLSAKSACFVLIDAFKILAAGLLAATLVSILGGLATTIKFMRTLSAATREHIATQAAANIQWKFTATAIRANAAALREHYIALGHSKVGSMAMAGAMTVARTATGYLTGALNGLRAAFLNPITLTLMATTALYQWITALEDANRRAEDFAKAYNERGTALAKEASDIKTLSDKAAFLAARYEELKKIREELSTAVDDGQIRELQDTERQTDSLIRKVEAMNDANLKAGQDRQKMLDDLAQLEKEFAVSKLNDTEKLLAKEKEIVELEAQRADKARIAADAAEAASVKSVSAIQAEINEQQKLKRSAEEALEQIASQRGIRDEQAARLAGRGVMVPRDNADLSSLQASAQADLAAANSRIGVLENSKQGRTAASEAANTALQSHDGTLREAQIEAEKLRASLKISEQKARIQAAELFTESLILGLKSEGAQRTIDEINLRQQLLALKIKEAEAEGKSLEVAEKKNQYAENERRLTEADKERNRRIEDARKERLNAVEERRIEQLPKKERIVALQQKQNALNKEASDFTERSKRARADGKEGEADEYALKAEQTRARADQYGFRADDLIRQNTNVTPVVSSLAKIGGAAGETSASNANSTRALLDAIRKQGSAVESIKTELSGLRQEMKRPPEWDQKFDDY